MAWSQASPLAFPRRLDAPGSRPTGDHLSRASGEFLSKVGSLHPPIPPRTRHTDRDLPTSSLLSSALYALASRAPSGITHTRGITNYAQERDLRSLSTAPGAAIAILGAVHSPGDSFRAGSAAADHTGHTAPPAARPLACPPARGLALTQGRAAGEAGRRAGPESRELLASRGDTQESQTAKDRAGHELP